MTEKLNSGHTNLTSKGFVYFIFIYIFFFTRGPKLGVPTNIICMRIHQPIFMIRCRKDKPFYSLERQFLQMIEHVKAEDLYFSNIM